MAITNIQVILNGVTLQESDYSGTKDSKVVLRQRDKEGLVFSYGNNLRLYGEGRKIIYDNIVNASNPQLASVPIVLKDTCCNHTMFEGLITFSDVKWCDITPESDKNCFVDVTFEDNSQIAQNLKCIKNTPIVARRSIDGTIQSNGEDEGKIAVYYRYCVESRPKVLMWLRMFFITSNLFFLVPVLYSLVPLLIFFGITPAEITEFKNNLTRDLVGCGKKHKAPFVYSYITNVCKLCGLTLRSSVFEIFKPYHLLTHLNIPFEDGKKKLNDANETFQKANFPSDTLTQFLDTFKNLNIDYAIEDGNVLVVERKDYFTNNIWIDFTARVSDIITLCYEFNDSVPFSGRVYEFQKDAGDIGEEANRLWGGPVINYNSPFNPILKGVDLKIVPFAPSRFVDDNFGTIIKGFRGVPFVGNAIPKDALVLSRGVASVPKLLMWDSSSSRNDGRVQHLTDPSTGSKIYNTPTWLTAQGPQIAPGLVDFYDRLLFIDDPRLNLLKTQNYELIFSYNCEDLSNFKFGDRIKFNQDRGGVSTLVEATVETVEIDYQKRQAKITGQI